MKRIAGILLLWIGLAVAGCKGTLPGSMSAASDYQKEIKYYETGEYSTAAEYFATAVDKELPKELEVYAYTYMGHCHFERENFDEAYVWYQKVPGKNPAPTAVPAPEAASAEAPIPTSTVIPETTAAPAVTVTGGKLIAIVTFKLWDVLEALGYQALLVQGIVKGIQEYFEN